MAVTSPAAVPPLPTFEQRADVRQGALNALARHVEHLHTHLLGGWRQRKPLAQLVLTPASGAVPGDNLAYFLNAFNSFTVDTETDHPDGPAAFSDCIRIRTSGVYLLTGQISVQANATGGTILGGFIALNGITLAQDAVARVFGRFPGGTPAGVCLTVLQPLVAGSLIRLLATQNSGSPAPLDATHGGCRLTAEWVAPLTDPEDLRTGAT